MPIILRGKSLHLNRRVPRRYAAVEPRTFIWISLHTDSASAAEAKADAIWANYIEGWEAKLAGDTTDAEARFAAARELAGVKGFRYLHASAVARLPSQELLQRIEAISLRRGEPNQLESAALLGAVPEPPITVSRALEIYWTLTPDQLRGKSDDQIRRWKNPRIKSVRNFIAVIGDKAVNAINGDDMLEFRDWWIERIETEDLTPNSGNKDLTHLGVVLKTVNRMKRLGLVLPLSDLKIKEGEARVRPPFSDTWIREKILALGALDGLNGEARAVLLVMVNTGCRPSEIVGLLETHIHLGGATPSISIEPEGRQLKSKNAKRVLPLTGVSFAAMREFPHGFPRYRGKAGLSATVNKFLRENGLMETPEHSLYGLRHAFEDRMLAAGIDERIRRDLLGHTLNRERYGKGASLELMHALVQPLAF